MLKKILMNTLIFFVLAAFIGHEPAEAARRGRPNIECARLMRNGVELFVPGKSWTLIDAENEIKNGYRSLTGSTQKFFVQLGGKPKQMVFEGAIASYPSPEVPVYKMFFKVKGGKDALQIFKAFALALEKSTSKNIFGGAKLFGMRKGIEKEVYIEDLESYWDEQIPLDRIETGVIEGHMMEGAESGSLQRPSKLLNIDIPDPLSPLSLAPNNYLFLMMFHLGRNEEVRSAEMLRTLVSLLGLSSSLPPSSQK